MSPVGLMEALVSHHLSDQPRFCRALREKHKGPLEIKMDMFLLPLHSTSQYTLKKIPRDRKRTPFLDGRSCKKHGNWRG